MSGAGGDYERFDSMVDLVEHLENEHPTLYVTQMWRWEREPLESLHKAVHQ